ncbi:MAG: ATP-binding domain-containing protein, partial [Peptococcaceae bacterium]|nr:ATP-binding domain-containing protein [Peptococcaceae bacterium]
YIMLQRNLLYTAITRAKHRLVLVCQESAVEVAVKNDKIQERYSRLKERLVGEND